MENSKTYCQPDNYKPILLMLGIKLANFTDGIMKNQKHHQNSLSNNDNLIENQIY